MDLVGEISKVKEDSNKTLIGVPLVDANLYFSGSTSCKERSRVEAMDMGMTLATDPESARMVTSPFWTPSCITVLKILGVGSETACERVAIIP